MIVNIRTDEITGPLTGAEFAVALRQNSNLASIKVRPVGEVWKELG
jgi:hypothetical protein